MAVACDLEIYDVKTRDVVKHLMLVMHEMRVSETYMALANQRVQLGENLMDFSEDFNEDFVEIEQKIN